MGGVVYLEDYVRSKCAYEIDEIAEYFLSRQSMSHKKLQKLCYYMQAWHLGMFGEPLMDAHFEAWKHGPVSPELYDIYKDYGLLHIPKIEDSVYFDDYRVQDLIETVYKVYGELPDNELVSLTQEEDPWKNARQGCGKDDTCTNRIFDNDIRKFYGSRFKQEVDHE